MHIEDQEVLTIEDDTNRINIDESEAVIDKEAGKNIGSEVEVIAEIENGIENRGNMNAGLKRREGMRNTRRGKKKKESKANRQVRLCHLINLIDVINNQIWLLLKLRSMPLVFLW